MSLGSFIIGATIGAGIGYVSSWLYAPKSGEETQADLQASADKLLENVKTQFDSTQVNVSELKTTKNERSQRVVPEQGRYFKIRTANKKRQSLK